VKFQCKNLGCPILFNLSGYCTAKINKPIGFTKVGIGTLDLILATHTLYRIEP
jgi:hypothetical protein